MRMKQQSVNALDGLELKELSNTNYVDSSMLEASASSHQNDGSNPENVLDDNPSTMWHTDWNVTTMPHWIDLQISEPTVVNGLYYLRARAVQTVMQLLTRSGQEC